MPFDEHGIVRADTRASSGPRVRMVYKMPNMNPCGVCTAQSRCRGKGVPVEPSLSFQLDGILDAHTHDRGAVISLRRMTPR